MMLRGFAILLMLCALFGHGQSGGTSKETRSLFTLLNGEYDNRDQVQNENSGNDVIYMRFIPAVVSELGPNPVLFFQEVVYTRNPHLSVIVAFEESSRLTRLSRRSTLSRRISSSVYNVTNPRLYEKPGSVTVDDVSNLQLGDLQPLDNCVARFQTIDDNLLIGVWENCLDSNKEILRLYVSVIRANDIYVVVPPEATETSTLVSYHFSRRGPRFPIPG